MKEWKEGYLSDIAEIIMGQSPNGETCNDKGEGLPLLNGPTEFGVKHPVAVQFTTDARKLSKIHDVLFCVRGSTTGKMNWADKEYAIGRGLAAIRHKEGKNYRYFIKGILDYNLELLLASATGSTFPNVSKDQLYELPILYPPLPEQTAIAAVLSSLDEKIDLLHRQNKTLEGLAEVVFRRWFVEGADDGWEDGIIEDLFILQRGFDLPSQNRIDGNFEVIAASGINGYHNQFKVKAPGVTTGRSGVIGKVFFLQEDFWPLNTSLFVKEFKIGSPLFSYFYLKSLDLESLNAGSAVPTLNRNHVHEIQIKIPPNELINRFEILMMDNFEKIKTNTQQIRTLTGVRDTLLPKVMSGEVRVGD